MEQREMHKCDQTRTPFQKAGIGRVGYAINPNLQLLLCMAVMLGVIMTLTACVTKRVAPPPAGGIYRVPWGALPVESWDQNVSKSFLQDLSEGDKTYLEELRSKNPNKRLQFNMLALSGGGSHGAYGAGVLTGWTASGKRQEFGTVTGISTGALMATAAFLGSEYDYMLRRYTKITNEDIYRKEGFALLGESVRDTAPLRKTIAELIDEKVLEAVASEHVRGRRLFIGTTNLDTQAFMVWDMGIIASSDRPDKLERYRKVVLVSASIPVLFPPVYISVDGGKESYQQMHVDGGVREMVLYYDFIEAVDAASTSAGLTRADVNINLYVLYNGDLYASGKYDPVEPTLLSIASSTLSALMRTNTLGSLYRVYVQALVYGINFHLAYIPREFQPLGDSVDFNPEDMARLFDFGYNQSITDEVWRTQGAVDDFDELIRTIDPMEALQQFEARPPFDPELPE